MAANKRGRDRWNGATPKNSQRDANSSRARAAIKAGIVTMAVWGIIPVGLARWLIRRGGLRHE